MSGKIPETMLLSDLLKATGYDCPEELQGRTFAEATAGGDVQTNKASTIDVSAYTEPIVVKPDTDYESMQKNTVTLSNIPVAKTEIALEATENKTYTPEEGKVYNSVTVNVPGTSKLCVWRAGPMNEKYLYIYRGVDDAQIGDSVLYFVSGNASLGSSTVSAINEDTGGIKIAAGGSYGYAVRHSELDFAIPLD